LATLNCEAYVSTLDLSKYQWNDERKEDTDGYVMTNQTQAIVYGMQPKAVQVTNSPLCLFQHACIFPIYIPKNMMDFDYVSRRKEPSAAAIVYRFAGGIHHRQFYWGSKEIMVPVYKDLESALNKHKQVDTIVNFASSRSAYQSTLDMLTYACIKFSMVHP